MADVSYTVRPDTFAEVVSTNPIDVRTAPCWSVTRMVDGFGWHIGKYRTEAAARAVADALAEHSGEVVL